MQIVHEPVDLVALKDVMHAELSLKARESRRAQQVVRHALG
ncbi:MAG TPA: hypothetical protein VFR59_01590 [Steroidobacteraceae bacterium]|nr:hypothetical protein [Steroidobacteraceae bacterium]